MKIKILIFLISLAIISYAFIKGDFKFSFGGTAYAIGDLTVNWGVPEGNPIFTVTNFAPGSSQTRNVIVTNNATTSRPVGVRGLKTLETGGLGDKLLIKISKSGTDLYGGTTGIKTLTQFFTASAGPDGIPLSTLSPSTSTTYVFNVTFDPLAGNEFQDKTIVFDLKIGIAITIPEACLGIDLTNKAPIFGTQNNDVIHGTSGDDVIFGLEGNDNIFGGGGNDCIIGGIGNDTLRGETGNDMLFGNEGNDLLIGAVGNDQIFGGDGNDTIRGENGNDILHGDRGNDTITGGNGSDIINGETGNDMLKGENGNDQVLGDEGNDVLDGGSGNDTLDGGSGIDTANGQSGTDTCSAETKTSCEL